VVVAVAIWIIVGVAETKNERGGQKEWQGATVAATATADGRDRCFGSGVVLAAIDNMTHTRRIQERGKWSCGEGAKISQAMLAAVILIHGRNMCVGDGQGRKREHIRIKCN